MDSSSASFEESGLLIYTNWATRSTRTTVVYPPATPASSFTLRLLQDGTSLPYVFENNREFISSVHNNFAVASFIYKPLLPSIITSTPMTTDRRSASPERTSAASPMTTTVMSAVPTQTSRVNEEDRSSLTDGAVAGIVVGVAVIVALLTGFLIISTIRYRWGKRWQSVHSRTASSAGAESKSEPITMIESDPRGD